MACLVSSPLSRLNGLDCVSRNLFILYSCLMACLRGRLAHFSENWGFVSLSPMIGSNIFSIAFGRNLDAHAPRSEAMATGADSPAARLTSLRTVSRAGWLYSRDGPPSTHQCLDGRACYVDTLKLTITACCVALVLALYAGWRDQRRQAKVALRGVEVVPEVVWEEDEG